MLTFLIQFDFLKFLSCSEDNSAAVSSSSDCMSVSPRAYLQATRQNASFVVCAYEKRGERGEGAREEDRERRKEKYTYRNQKQIKNRYRKGDKFQKRQMKKTLTKCICLQFFLLSHSMLVHNEVTFLPNS